MKIVNILIGLTIILGTMVAIESFIIKPATTTEISVLWDITDTTIGKPKSEEIVRLYELEGSNMWNGVELRFSTLSNVNFNQTKVLSIPARNKWLSNELVRQKEINTFNSQVVYLIDSPQAETDGKQHSSIFWPLFTELKRLGTEYYESGAIGTNRSNKKILVIQSDLMENYSSLSLYDPKQFQFFTSNPQSVKFIIENFSQLPSLTGTEIYMLYEPKDATDSERYTLISDMLKSLLEQKGAKMYRSANLIR
jgi:hypothetical protein